MNYSVWKTNVGEFINIKDMSTKHIKNCIAMIERSQYPDMKDYFEDLPEPPARYTVDYELYKPYLDIFKMELKSR